MWSMENGQCRDIVYAPMYAIVNAVDTYTLYISYVKHLITIINGRFMLILMVATVAGRCTEVGAGECSNTSLVSSVQ